MICFVIVFSFVTLIFLKHKEYAHTRAHTHTNAADINTCVCVCVWVFRSACGCMSVRVLYSRAQMVRILLCLYKATIIKSQTLELNHKYWEILLLTWCLTQSCPALCATLSDLDNQHVQYFEILGTFSTGSMQLPASICQPPEVPQKKSFILP